jgi:hypothetical protein
MTRASLAALLVGLLALASAPAARANGRFPRAQHIVVGPGAASYTIALRATFGLVVSDDGGATFRFLCEEAFEYLDGYDPSLALGADAALLVGTRDGLMVLRDRCSPRRQRDLAQHEVRDLATDPSGRVVLAALASPGSTPLARVARSDDGGASFTLPLVGLEGVRLETVEVAPSDPSRVYATGTVDARDVFFRSDDGGTTFRATAASFAGATGAFISGVDPRRPGVVYVRARVGASPGDAGAQDQTALLRSDDGGEHFTEIARTVGPMAGFALSDDGRRVWIGGPDPRDGLLRSDDGGAFARVNATPVDCLRYHAGALYACGVYQLGGAMGESVLLWRSTDEGATLRPLARFADIRPPPMCPAGTILHDICPLRWSSVLARLSPERDAGPRDTGADAGSAMGGGMGGGMCGCAAPGRARTGLAGVLVAVMAALLRRRGRRVR